MKAKQRAKRKRKSKVKLIVGLGNPGNIYANTRHNIGFISIDALAKEYNFFLKKDRLTFSLNAKGDLGGCNVVLAMPQSFMNLSGIAVRNLVKKYKISSDNLLVICDDLDLEFGRIKIRPFGSSGGHQGLKSIIDLLGTNEFARLRVGIGRPLQQLAPKNDEKADCRGSKSSGDQNIVRYVLAPFSKKERLEEVISKVSDCCKVWVAKDVTEAMNAFNSRK